ncbi:hypothetical protein NPIL_86591 [Nephila pilipes]|uniref:Uncharacterized protein n=1 Tax=Nephila pilipes TaxID=299642 RepID=A0A8X6UA12_NEPPI|nr:hypothetical protein NPIL_86591 [Nephila pilipes]
MGTLTYLLSRDTLTTQRNDIQIQLSICWRNRQYPYFQSDMLTIPLSPPLHQFRKIVVHNGTASNFSRLILEACVCLGRHVAVEFVIHLPDHMLLLFDLLFEVTL